MAVLFMLEDTVYYVLLVCNVRWMLNNVFSYAKII